jgi:hypothetical protein
MVVKITKVGMRIGTSVGIDGVASTRRNSQTILTPWSITFAREQWSGSHPQLVVRRQRASPSASPMKGSSGGVRRGFTIQSKLSREYFGLSREYFGRPVKPGDYNWRGNGVRAERRLGACPLGTVQGL